MFAHKHLLEEDSKVGNGREREIYIVVERKQSQRKKEIRKTQHDSQTRFQTEEITNHRSALLIMPTQIAK